MGRLVIDNWTLEKAVHSFETVFTSHPDYNNEFVNFVESIVLWDELLYWENGREIVWTTRNKEAVKSFLSVLDNIKFSEDSYNNQIDHVGVKERGAILYYNACNNNDCGYLAVEERAEFLKCYVSNVQVPDRRTLSGYFDHKTYDNYQNIITVFDKQPIRFSSIFYRVLQGARNPSEIIQSAIELRNSNDARMFRQYMDVIEHEDIDKLNKHTLSIIKDINRLFNNDNCACTTEITLNLWLVSAKSGVSTKVLNPNDYFCSRKLNFFKVLRNSIKCGDEIRFI